MTVVAFPTRTTQPCETLDAEARRDALDTTRSFIVEAPAGSGKTGLLIQRYLRLLTVVDQPESVLALTFTNKATAEMRHRVLSALEAAQEPLPNTAEDYERETWTTARSVLDHDAALHWNLLQQPHRLNLRTIDSLCGEIARAVPVLSGGIGNATPIPEANPLYRAAARTVLLQLGGPDAALNRALETVLYHRDADLADCETLLADMLATREQWGSLVPLSRRELNDATLDQEVLPRLNAALESVLCATLTDLREQFPDHLLQEVAAVAHLLSGADGYNNGPNPLRPCAAMPHAPGTAADDVEHWKLLAHLLVAPSSGTWRKAFAVNHLGFKITKPEKIRIEHALEDLREDDQLLALLHAVRALPPATYPADQWHVAKALFVVLHHALIELRLLFAAREVCDFTELSMAARTALEAGHSTTEALNLRLEHLLVDEMQDTSSAQYALLEALTAHWDGRTQTVFLVGDPKQSIYLFRQARVERFLTATRDELLGDIPLTALQLSSNFRSGGTLVDAFNTTFSTVFQDTGAIRYTTAAAALPPTEDDTLTWNATPLPAATDPAALKQSRREEAESIAAYAHHWRGKPLPPGRDKPWKIAVLVRNRTHAFEVMRKLAEAQVPFRAVEMEELGERPEILDLLALTRALLHPADRTAWLALLRAPWCGLTLADLHTLAAGDQPTQRKQALRQHLRVRVEHLAADSRARALHTLDLLDAALARRGRNPLSVDIAETWAALQGSHTTDALGRTNARRFFELLEQMEAAGEPINAVSLKIRLARLYAEPASTPDAVEVLTIHKAKGLEWDAVLVPGLHRPGRADSTPLLDWMELPPDTNGIPQVLLAPISKRGDDPDSLNRYLRKAHTEAASAELQRLFYVAATRARTALQLYASPITSQDGTVTYRANTLLHAARMAAEPHFTQTPLAPPATRVTVPAIPLDAPGLALAASGTEATGMEETPPHSSGLDVPETANQREPILRRLPLHLLQATTASPADLPAPHHAHAIVRPQGSVAARVLGNTVHAFLERLANAPQSDAELAAWPARIRTVVRGSGLSPRDAERVTADTLRALENTTNTPEAAWLFHPHREARNEGELVAPSTTGPARFRFDRSFFAGTAPLAPGDDTLWIVDYKTSTYREADHAGDTREAFLARERATYQPHLENYARLMLRDLPATTPVMLALYYPLLPWLDAFSYAPA